jgi:hypothetical protein
VEQLTQVDAHVSGIVLIGPDIGRRYGYGYYESDRDGEAADLESEQPASSENDEGVEAGARSPWNTNRPPGPGGESSSRHGRKAASAGPTAKRPHEPTGHAPM